jgi:Zn finger protein HypA/HybF involved in hydrogenase expression
MSEDLIKRSDAIEALLRMDGTKIDKALAMGEIRSILSADRPQKVIAQITFDEEKLREIVKEAVERFKEEYEITDRPQGKWIKIDDVSISCRCSVCGWEAHLYEDDVYGMPYCPNCGARMKGADDE